MILSFHAMETAAAPTLVTQYLPYAKLNVPYSSRLLVTSASPIASANFSGLPPGLSLSQEGNGVLLVSGTPTVPGDHEARLTVNDSTGGSLNVDFVVAVVPLASHISSISAGSQYTCATLGGGVQCWGYATSYQLGVPYWASGGPMKALPYSAGATQVSAGDVHTCAVVAGGVACWGANANGQLGDGSTTLAMAPVQVIAAGSGATQVSAGNRHTCAVVKGGLMCWGSNNFGQFGNGTYADSAVPSQVLPPQSGVTAVAAGGDFTCAIVAAAVRCTGRNDRGQLGVINGQAFTSNPVQTISAGAMVTSLSTGAAHACVVANGGVQCWGESNYGQTGVIVAGYAPTPVSPFPAGSGATIVSAGTESTCAVVNAGLHCWGSAPYGQFGLNKRTASNTPIEVLPAGSDVGTVTVGGRHVCIAISANLRCSGDNFYGAVGNGYFTYSTARAPFLAGSAGPTLVRAAKNFQGRACALVNGGVQCWGYHDQYRYLSPTLSGSVERSVLPIAAVAAGSGVTALDAGGDHNCAVVAGGVVCWGNNMNGALGSSVPEDFVFQAIAAGSNVTAIATGWSHTCAVVAGGLQCWGSNNRGQLGDGTVSPQSLPIQTFPAGSGVSAAAAGMYSTCAIVNGGVKCWGGNTSGELGNGTQTDSTTVVDTLPAGSGALSISASHDHYCTVVSGGVKCWGANSSGKVGAPTAGPYLQTLPVDVFMQGSGVQAVAAGGNHTCALVGGGVKCWGQGSRGLLGNFSGISTHLPQDVIVGGSGVSDIGAGYGHACAVAGGAVVCWGENLYGETGDAETINPWTFTRTLLYEPPPHIVAAVSRKLHGAAGNFDLPIRLDVALDGPITVEPRSGADGHNIVVVLDAPVSQVGGVVARDSFGNTIGNAATAINGSEVTVTLTNIPNINRVKLQLGQINGSASSTEIPIGFLLGDIDNSRAVDAIDLQRARSRIGTPVNAGNFQYDLNLNGTVSIADIVTVKTQRLRDSALP